MTPGMPAMGKDMVMHCTHPSLSGAEGAVVEMGRWPVLWQCDTCGVLIVDVINACKVRP